MKYKNKIVLSFVTSLILVNGVYAKDTLQKLDSVIVTANKIEENVQEVPISITVFDEFAIEDKKIESIEDVASYTSNFTLINKGGGIFAPTIRGISNSLPFSTAGSQPTSVIVDGIPISSAQGFNVNLMDIQRIEVLKGPQGTLYGKEAQAGVINVITKKPNNETKAKVGIELGEDNKREYTLSVGGPIVENKFYVGLSTKHYEKDGFIENTTLGGYTNDKENDYGRLHLRYTPSDDLEISFISSKLQYDNGNLDYISPYIPDVKSMSSTTQGYDKSSTTSHALKVSYDINDYLFESITTYRNVKSDSLLTYSFGDYNYDRDDDKYSQELRLSNSNDTFKWVAGIYADKNEIIYSSQLVNTASNPSTTKTDSLGVFIHTDYAINDKLSFISGARYDKDNKEYEQATTKLDFSDSEISPKISLKYQYDQDSMYYATISKGYRSGGVFAGAADGYSKTYETETLLNYEIGAKNSFFDNRLIVNSSIFYMKIDDMQVRVPIPNTVRESYINNAAKATSKGFEIGLNGKLTDTLELFGAYGYTNATFDDYKDAQGDYSGNKNLFAPAYNYNLGIQYRDENGYFARADLNGYGKIYSNPSNTKGIDAYELVNAKIGYEADNYDIYLYGKNIFDKEYHEGGSTASWGALLSPPREIGVQLAYRF